jgi:phosphatidylglycerophosphatase A
MRRVGVFLATAAGAGYSPVAPGTAGSAVGILLYFLTRHWPAASQIALLVTICVVGTWAANEAARHFNRKDPGHVVIDEVAGQLLTLLLLGMDVAGACLGFLLFRGLDIVKPWPARQFEAWPGGLGIMADDLMAGAYGWVILWAGAALLARIW